MNSIILFVVCISTVRTQFHPLSEVLMRAIPDATNVKNIPITRIDVIQTLYTSVLKCTPESVITRIVENVESIGNKTCNGFIFSNEPYLYYAVLSGQTVQLNVDEMTIVSAAMNGNIIFITCGYIVGGVCEGDYLFSVQIYKADDQDACTGSGLTSQTAIYYPLDIYGTCQSSCIFEESTVTLKPPISN